MPVLNCENLFKWKAEDLIWQEEGEGAGVRDVGGRRLLRGRAGIAQYRCFTRNDTGKSANLNILVSNDSCIFPSWIIY